MSAQIQAQGGVAGGTGGPACSSCNDTCKKGAKQCKKDIDGLKGLCHATGNKMYCEEAKKRGCKSAKLYCQTMCLVSFGESNSCQGKNGSTVREPHLLTFDGLAYDFQAAGEFVLAQSDDGRLEVQVRQTPFSNRNTVTANSAVAARFDGFVISHDLRDPEGLFLINNKPAELTATRGTLSAEVKYARNEHSYVFLHAELGSVRLTRLHDMLDVSVNLADANLPISGLLGNNNGSYKDDLSVLGAPVANPKVLPFELMYGPFADTWRVNAETSLLPYKTGESTVAFTNRDFPQALLTIDNIAPIEREKAEQACSALSSGNRVSYDACVYDVAITGDTDLAAGFPDFGVPSVATSTTVADAPGFDNWTAVNLMPTSKPFWRVAKRVQGAEVKANQDIPAFLLSPNQNGPVRLSTKLSIKASRNKDHIGFVLGFQEATSDNFDFLLLDWKHSKKSYRGKSAPEGWRLTRYQGPPSKDRRGNLDILADFWEQTTNGPSQPIAASTGEGMGWQFDTEYRVDIAYSQTSIVVHLDGEKVLNAEGNFPAAGKLGLYNFSQPDLLVSQILLYD